MRHYYCEPCNKIFTTEDSYHPECPTCKDENTYEVIRCDVCQGDFHFGNPDKGGVVIAYSGSHEVLLEDDILYTIELTQDNTCYRCCHELIKEGKGRGVPPKTCKKCGSVHQDMYGWDGSDVSSELWCSGGYGSTQFDMDTLLFKSLSPGWYCYPCLDKEVIEQRTEEIED